MGYSFNPSLWFVCKLCKDTFPNPDELKNHKLQTHLGDCLKIKSIVFEEKLLDYEWTPSTSNNHHLHSSQIENQISTLNNKKVSSNKANFKVTTARTPLGSIYTKRRGFVNPYVSLTQLTQNEVNSALNVNVSVRHRTNHKKKNKSCKLSNNKVAGVLQLDSIKTRKNLLRAKQIQIKSESESDTVIYAVEEKSTLPYNTDLNPVFDTTTTVRKVEYPSTLCKVLLQDPAPASESEYTGGMIGMNTDETETGTSKVEIPSTSFNFDTASNIPGGTFVKQEQYPNDVFSTSSSNFEYRHQMEYFGDGNVNFDENTFARPNPYVIDDINCAVENAVTALMDSSELLQNQEFIVASVQQNMDGSGQVKFASTVIPPSSHEFAFLKQQKLYHTNQVDHFDHVLENVEAYVEPNVLSSGTAESMEFSNTDSAASSSHSQSYKLWTPPQHIPTSVSASASKSQQHASLPPVSPSQSKPTKSKISTINNNKRLPEFFGTTAQLFQCKTCCTIFRTKNELMKHYPVEPFKCGQCCQGFKYDKDRRNHMGSAHGKRVPLVFTRVNCHFCDQSFSSVSELREHEENHITRTSSTGVQSFKCVVPNCSNSEKFSSRSDLSAHIRVHHGDELFFGRFPCPFPTCPRNFQLKAHLQKHMKVHSKFRCLSSRCGSGFETREELLKHNERCVLK